MNPTRHNEAWRDIVAQFIHQAEAPIYLAAGEDLDNAMFIAGMLRVVSTLPLSVPGAALIRALALAIERGEHDLSVFTVANLPATPAGWETHNVVDCTSKAHRVAYSSLDGETTERMREFVSSVRLLAKVTRDESDQVYYAGTYIKDALAEIVDVVTYLDENKRSNRCLAGSP